MRYKRTNHVFELMQHLVACSLCSSKQNLGYDLIINFSIHYLQIKEGGEMDWKTQQK